MPTINQLLLDAIKYDEVFMAYSIYLAVQEGVLKLSDGEEKFREVQFPDEKIRAAIESDSLKLYTNMIKLYLVRYENDYAVYLSKSEKEVASYHYKLFGEAAERIVDMTHKKDTEIYDEAVNDYLSFRDIQERTVSFPRFICLLPAKKRKVIM